MASNDKNKIDKIFFGIVLSLVIIGLIMFISASLGILNKNESKFYGVMFNQVIYGLFGGLVALYFGLKIPYKFWRQYSLPLFIISIIATTLVFVPGLGMEHGGSRRWIEVFGISLQPVEFLKIGFVIYFAAWLSWVKGRVQDFRFSLLPLIVLLGIITAVLINQPDTKSLILITTTAMIMLFVSGTPWKYILGLFAVSILAFAILAFTTPYLQSRIKTFINPNENGSTSSYQIQQSLIAVGTGGIAGRGLGQSIQKFNYLPEPQGDSIFAVIGEEVGFIGGAIIICLYVAFALRGYRIAHYAPDSFSKLFVIGTITIITAQSFMNIASIIGVFPLTGVPLVFMSHGGTALLLDIGLMGIVLNISKFQKSPTLEKK
ncbi:MAG: stage V sporulation protein E [Candidatus Nomurabacteria bacterium GW2011_GWF2_35_66]|uniref:Probable peptidoglycan glycosyltransferase FtsW n=1 Tax=Candidatus Nomurabacteria bacterium GW2011_GWE1_35_16 TaxID=1618761 RepID=A0A0G0BSG2_9BACT|nr:MAG: stage V sporulation protein E [Candidatus Nomurabacteria bacterium GW2011_GWF1_34_20]KKP63379.1 MAG: stage V sporulation protein E [Candidatus Nomurabacteria bacterium GW2011_GWE2_34_25]KKP66571.1 MAG: stage V sporulation protein E [Candidatus Nomurabacteria bacterium GW2011_GWE1_35_16]KKP83617.1 MAG: stage V sporulation protein E [Candidatus Nomurabacteria bacterium GW2011_GWF2_35_66]HAE36877.1 stage V sporulation protein E [Candidatus Nomurabacteria bacterium]